MAEYESWNEDRARDIIAAVAVKEGAALPILHALQRVSAAFRSTPNR